MSDKEPAFDLEAAVLYLVKREAYRQAREGTVVTPLTELYWLNERYEATLKSLGIPNG